MLTLFPVLFRHTQCFVDINTPPKYAVTQFELIKPDASYLMASIAIRKTYTGAFTNNNANWCQDVLHRVFGAKRIINYKAI